jgi:hypothetical protein
MAKVTCHGQASPHSRHENRIGENGLAATAALSRHGRDTPGYDGNEMTSSTKSLSTERFS